MTIVAANDLELLAKPPKLDNETLQELNAAVDGEPEETVARQFLRENGLL